MQQETKKKPNILFLMADMMQGRVLRPDHPCRTPTLDKLAGMGVRFERAYTVSPICGPARAGLMTGLLPHSHGVVENPHCLKEDEANLRTEYPHWAQRLQEAGYRTGYFGKWHVERSNQLKRFGWEVEGRHGNPLWRKCYEKLGEDEKLTRTRLLESPPGYHERVIYGVSEIPPEKRSMGITTTLAEEFLAESLADNSKPWCCFVSFQEPHNPYAATGETLELYDVDSLELPASQADGMSDKPGLYRKLAELWQGWTERQRKECSACYFARITEVDSQFARLIEMLEDAGQLDQTVIIHTSDHGQMNWAHGLNTMNASFEEMYNIPMIISGPGIADGVVSDARVGLHDLCPTILELSGAAPISHPDSRSFADVLRDPQLHSGNFIEGYAEYHGGRFRLSQRVIWQGKWKFILNGFDYNEMYNLEDDPQELRNLAGNRVYKDVMVQLMDRMWQIMKETGDTCLYNSHYPSSRMAPVGPEYFPDQD